MGIWPDQPYFFRGRGGNVAVLMHIQYTHTVGNQIVMANRNFCNQKPGLKAKVGQDY